MWIVTKYGFFSVVKSRESNEQMIRARDENHLYNLMDAFPEILGDKNILFTADSDYPCRFLITKEEWLKLIVKIGEDATTYNNFKDEAFAYGASTEYNMFLHELWSLGVKYLQSIKSMWSY